jgi:hypothetical protein
MTHTRRAPRAAGCDADVEAHPRVVAAGPRPSLGGTLKATRLEHSPLISACEPVPPVLPFRCGVAGVPPHRRGLLRGRGPDGLVVAAPEVRTRIPRGGVPSSGRRRSFSMSGRRPRTARQRRPQARPRRRRALSQYRKCSPSGTVRAVLRRVMRDSRPPGDVRRGPVRHPGLGVFVGRPDHRARPSTCPPAELGCKLAGKADRPRQPQHSDGHTWPPRLDSPDGSASVAGVWSSLCTRSLGQTVRPRTPPGVRGRARGAKFVRRAAAGPDRRRSGSGR